MFKELWKWIKATGIVVGGLSLIVGMCFVVTMGLYWIIYTIPILNYIVLAGLIGFLVFLVCLMIWSIKDNM